MALSRALRVRCPAKINLGLWILGRRPDGYHEIDTIMQSVALEDELLLTESSGGLTLTTRGLPIPKDAPNILERAWALVGAVHPLLTNASDNPDRLALWRAAATAAAALDDDRRRVHALCLVSS